MSLTDVLTYLILPGCTIIFIPCIRWLIMKFNHIDEELQSKMSQQEIRQLIEDKTFAQKEKLEDLKNSIDKIFDYLLKDGDTK